MLMNNFILKTDSYKFTHFDMLPKNTEYTYSYFESRPGARFPFTVFFGLQYLLERYMSGAVVDQNDIEEAEQFVETHLGDKKLFNRAGWEYIVNNHGGRLPIKIKAVPEGTVVPAGNVLMTVETTDPKCAWLTNYVETFLTHVWYGSTVATLSKVVKNELLYFLDKTGDVENINFMLHDFGYRGVSSDESAAVGGAAHIINFMGTDTVVGMCLAEEYYFADLGSLAFSVPATEHSVMTALGRDGEYSVLDDLLENYPTGILSVVADSYDIYKFTEEVVKRKDKILARDGRFVLRPDSVTPKDRTPADLVISLLDMLWDGFGGEINAKGYRVLDTHVRVIWGDGIDLDGISDILELMMQCCYSADNIVFGMGGGLLQKVNRDTQRFAFKSSAQMRDGVWRDVVKEPLQKDKRSKAGRLKLVRNKETNSLETVRIEDEGEDILQTVWINGHFVKEYTFDEVRENSNK